MKTPSVTMILSPYADFSMVPPDVLANAAARGSLVHQACAAIAQDIWISELSEDCRGYVDSFSYWLDATAPEILATEIELVDPVHSYHGHPDLICKIGEDVVVIDYKTPVSVSPSWRLQLAAYLRLALVSGYRANRTAVLRLSSDGKRPIFDEFTATTARDFAVFLNALSVWRYFQGDK